MDFDQLYPKRFMKAGEFQKRDLTFTVSKVRLEELGEGNEKKGKAIVTFKETKKEWVMNVTNGLCLKAMFGRETNDWTGKRVTLFPAEINDPFTGELTLAIRVRGSPEIASPLEFSARVGRKQVTMKLAKTGRAQPKAAPAKQPEPTPETPLMDDPFTDGQEPPPDMLLPGQAGYTP